MAAIAMPVKIRVVLVQLHHRSAELLIAAISRVLDDALRCTVVSHDLSQSPAFRG